MVVVIAELRGIGSYHGRNAGLPKRCVIASQEHQHELLDTDVDLETQHRRRGLGRHFILRREGRAPARPLP